MSRTAIMANARCDFRSRTNEEVTEHLERLGHVPLPPYIERADESADRERYQTIFARRPGAIAAPTAGLHFTPEILEKIRARGVEICELTLHVGLGTFQPIRGETLEGHVMHGEEYEISRGDRASASRGPRGRPPNSSDRHDHGARAGRCGPACAVRRETRLLVPGKPEARLFITPGFHFRVVDALLTNFHLPRSTLLALVCAFAGRERMLAAYRHAVEAGYRFYSYGDCMLIR